MILGVNLTGKSVDWYQQDTVTLSFSLLLLPCLFDVVYTFNITLEHRSECPLDRLLIYCSYEYESHNGYNLLVGINRIQMENILTNFIGRGE